MMDTLNEPVWKNRKRGHQVEIISNGNEAHASCRNCSWTEAGDLHKVEELTDAHEAADA